MESLFPKFQVTVSFTSYVEILDSQGDVEAGSEMFTAEMPAAEGSCFTELNVDK